MIYTIENDKIRVGIEDKGAQLYSIYGKTTDFEYLYQGKKGFWCGRTPILFPICGRLKDGICTYKGQTYKIPLHGFARSKIFTVTKHTKTKIVFTITEDKKSLKQYPFKFKLDVVYSVKGAKVSMEMNVTNTGDVTLPFSIGGHPGFNIPLEKGARFHDHYLQFAKKTDVHSLIYTPEVLYTGKTAPYKLHKGKILNLKHNLFDVDGVFLANMSDTVTLKSDKAKRFVKLTAPKATHIGFWHDPRRYAPFVCIEPWRGVFALDGVTEDLETKLEMSFLNAGETYNYPIYMQFGE